MRNLHVYRGTGHLTIMSSSIPSFAFLVLLILLNGPGDAICSDSGSYFYYADSYGCTYFPPRAPENNPRAVPAHYTAHSNDFQVFPTSQQQDHHQQQQHDFYYPPPNVYCVQPQPTFMPSFQPQHSFQQPNTMFLVPPFESEAPPQLTIPQRDFSSTNPQLPSYFDLYPFSFRLPPPLIPVPASREVVTMNESKKQIKRLKRNIRNAITFNFRSASSPDKSLNLGSFLFTLHEDSFSLALPVQTHLNWLLEFASDQYFRSEHREGCQDYYDYIKTNHLERDIRNDPEILIIIRDTIIAFIGRRCALPEVIGDLLRIYEDFMQVSDHILFYVNFKDALVLAETCLTGRAMTRFSITLEYLLKFVPVPLYVVLFESQFILPQTSIMRSLLHLSPIYRLFLVKEPIDMTAISSAIGYICQFADGSRTDSYSSWYMFTVNEMLKRVNSAYASRDPKYINDTLDRYEMIIKELIKSFSINDFYLFSRNRLDFAVDAFIVAESESLEFDTSRIEFVYLVVNAWNAYSKVDPFLALNQISSFLVFNYVPLDDFRSVFKPVLAANMPDSGHFLLVLEAVLAAIDGLEAAQFYSTWEPSRAFLILLNEIKNVPLTKLEERRSIITSPFLLCAAKIFICRQSGFQMSLFAGKIDSDQFSWKDALDYVNFYTYHYFPAEIFEKIKVSSQFWDDVSKAESYPINFDDIIRIFDSKEYKSTTVEIEASPNSAESVVIIETNDSIDHDAA